MRELRPYAKTILGAGEPGDYKILGVWMLSAFL